MKVWYPLRFANFLIIGYDQLRAKYWKENNATHKFLEQNFGSQKNSLRFFRCIYRGHFFLVEVVPDCQLLETVSVSECVRGSARMATADVCGQCADKCVYCSVLYCFEAIAVNLGSKFLILSWLEHFNLFLVFHFRRAIEKIYSHTVFWRHRFVPLEDERTERTHRWLHFIFFLIHYANVLTQVFRWIKQTFLKGMHFCEESSSCIGVAMTEFLNHPNGRGRDWN